MKRTSVQLAAAMATLAVAASASAQSNVTLYGRLDVSMSQSSIESTTGASRSLTAVSSDGSRWGLRGSEDIGGGLKANFQVENGFLADTGAAGQGGLLFGRQSWVGLSSSMGEVRLGRNTISLDDLTWLFDPFYAGGVGALWPLLPYISTVNNSVKYVSPWIGQLQLGAMISADEGVVGGGQRGLSAYYKGTPFELGFGYTILKNPNPTLAGDTKQLYLSGAWKFDGGHRIVASTFQRDDVGAQKLTVTNVGGNLSLGGGDLRISLIKTTQGDESTKQSSIGYWYPMTKRTFVYGALTSQDNSNNRKPAMNPGPITMTNGDDFKTAQIGVRHNF